MKLSKIFEEYDVTDTEIETNDDESLLEDEDSLVIGVTGFVSEDDDETMIYEVLDNFFDQISDEFSEDFDEFVVACDANVSKLSTIAFKIAEERGYKTIGIGFEDDISNIYPTDEFIFCDEGENQINYFVDSIDVLIKVGDDSFSNLVAEEAQNQDLPIFEYKI